MTTDITAFEDLLRRSAPQVLARLVRRHGQFDACEEAVQDALLAAAAQWPLEGVPLDPTGWLHTVARRRLIDSWRSEHARRAREELAAAQTPDHQRTAPDASQGTPGHSDDTLSLFFLCCHPRLSSPSQIALTLRAVGGLTTAQIARAFLVPEATMAQRISRAKQQITKAGAELSMPPEPERSGRLEVVLHVLYLIFNEGYTATSGGDLQCETLATEAIRLTRLVRALRPDGGEVAGLLALMLLTDSRRGARTTGTGAMIPLADQDRTLWDHALIDEGVALISETLAHSTVGAYQLQAAIAAVHAEAPDTARTDWHQILILYKILDRVAPNPMATLNRAVATAMVHGPQAGLALLAELDTDKRIAGHYRIDAVRGHLLRMAGDHAGARTHYLSAAKHTLSVPEQRYLESCAAQLAAPNDRRRGPS
ncbi:RNA polymerase sigma factor [Rhodococcus maanshanensis]|uniref:Predicted RNA polymerase sigma factor, contains C-terminal TPR domain n=1 Tax=Rhodococcus maanshanensis TaxID=183556 RepID=A0A1H7RTE1_9NOCA|nr:DUF6596 domain-containing protein [Rhodococcus maanshanensis]SEL63453.1 Predicted RNA polymerase sigma factor, contains C-terminal TPR domain [Rhodococcus maanshanensis]